MHDQDLQSPKPIHKIPPSFCKNLSILFTDIDDTLTTGGLLPPSSYTALWKLIEHGIQVVPVTGRPAGWCDHIARMWPVAAVIGENGAFYFAYDRKNRKMRREYFDSKEKRAEAEAGLARIRDEVLRRVPGAAVAADQPFRIADLAIDFREDVHPLDDTAIEEICEIARTHGAICKVSSIHVNIWYGSYDKVSCIRAYLEREGGKPFSEWKDRILFIGDSPNDEPNFQHFPVSVGVANIRTFLPRLKYPPRYVTSLEGAEGFAEAVEWILQQRNQ
ncbi:MAG: Cof-type HAD-IIB family hydrolase [Spirochaetes bacterium]|nr:Cof-type HAD-IIB family hydrolase [Spirochaetota bacterium]